MKQILKVLPLRKSYLLSAIVIMMLLVFNFYGSYTGEFYFVKLNNYIFPLLALIHVVYLYVLWFKITEKEMTDIQMRNLEYVFYGVLGIYIIKTIESAGLLFTYSEYENHLLPMGFLAIAITKLVLHILLLGLTILTLKYRQDRVGNYNFHEMDHIDSWE